MTGKKKEDLQKELSEKDKSAIDEKELEKVSGGLRDLPVDNPTPISDDTRGRI